MTVQFSSFLFQNISNIYSWICHISLNGTISVHNGSDLFFLPVQSFCFLSLESTHTHTNICDNGMYVMTSNTQLIWPMHMRISFICVCVCFLCMCELWLCVMDLFDGKCIITVTRNPQQHQAFNIRIINVD